MIETILSIFSTLWKPIAGALGVIAVILFQRWRIKRKDALIDRQQQVIQAQEAKEEVHEHDVKLHTEADQKIEEVREKVNEAETPEAAAGIVAEELNKYFGGDK